MPPSLHTQAVVALSFVLVMWWLAGRAWNRRRDLLILRVDAARPPRPGRVESRRPAARLGLRRLLLAATQPASPHVQVSFAVGAGEEDDVARVVHLASVLARGECVL